MGPRARGETIGKVRSEYIVFGDFVSHSPYVYAMTAYWVPLSKLINDVTRAKAVVEIEIFEGNLAQLREIEMAELSSRRTRRRATPAPHTSVGAGEVLLALSYS